MRKVYIKRALLNEDVTITDPTLAQQYLAVKKQMADKKMKRDQTMKTVNQIDNEINILEKNLIAIETKANTAVVSNKDKNPAENQQQETSQTAGKEVQANESVSSSLIPPSFPSIDDYREAVISAIDEIHVDGETLAYLYDDVVQDGYDMKQSPIEIANEIVILKKNHEEINDSYIGGDNIGKFEANRSTQVRVVENANGSVYDDMISNIEKELNKLSDIKNYIENWDSKDQPDVNIDINIDTDAENVPETPGDAAQVLPAIPVEELPVIPSEEEPEEPEEPELPVENEINFPSLEDKNYDDMPAMDIEIDREDPFEPSEDNRIVDETLKAEKKSPYVPSLLEDEDLENELEMMNYEDEDEPSDEYVFHVRINPKDDIDYNVKVPSELDESSEDEDLEFDEDEEIIAKFYRDSEDDNWEVRVVQGDEEPLQSMEFDSRLDKLDIIGELASIPGFNEIEIIDPKEYEYLLDDKEKVDDEYYDVVEENFKENVSNNILYINRDFLFNKNNLGLEVEPFSYPDMKEDLQYISTYIKGKSKNINDIRLLMSGVKTGNKYFMFLKDDFGGSYLEYISLEYCKEMDGYYKFRMYKYYPFREDANDVNVLLEKWLENDPKPYHFSSYKNRLLDNYTYLFEFNGNRY